MKKITTLFTALLFIMAIVLSNQVKAQAPSCPWAKKAGSSLEDLATSVTTDAFGNVYTVGDFFSQTIVIGTTTLHNLAYNNGEASMFITKFDACGNFRWAKQMGGDDLTRAKSVTTDAAGNVFIAGYFRADTLHFGGSSVQLLLSSSTDAFVAKYDSAGTVSWAQQGSGDAQDEIYSVTTDPSGNVYVAGAFASTVLTVGTFSVNNFNNQSDDDPFVAKFDNNGVAQWLKSGSGNYEDEAYGISTDAAGNVYVSGTFGSASITFGALNATLSTNGYFDIFVMKYDPNGTPQWLKTAGGNTNDNEALSIATDASGNSYVTGYIGSSYNGGTPITFGTINISNLSAESNMFIAKYDASGTVQWAQASKGDIYTYGNTGNNIKLDGAGNPYVIGSFNSDSLSLGPITIYNNSLLAGGGDTIQDVFVVKYKANGSPLWARSAGGSANDLGLGIATGANNALYVCGEYQSPSITFAGISLTSVNTAGDAFIANNISTSVVTPNICMVSADSLSGTNQYNVVYWDKTAYNNVSSFIIYRETTSGIYQPIGSRSYANLSQFTDTARHVGSTTATGGDPNSSTYRYKIQILDTSGTYSLMSPYHNTVYFVNNGSGTFTWNEYLVENASITPVSIFNLVRDDYNTGVWDTVASTSGTQTTLNDINYSTYVATANWRVDGSGFDCNPTLRLANGNNSTYAARVKSHSNQNNNRQAGIKQLLNSSQVNIYPNPNKGNFTIETTVTERQAVQVFDVNGKLVFSQTINGNTSIDASNLSEGVYNVSIVGNEGVVNKRLVIVR